MKNRILHLIILLITVAGLKAFSQENTYSPYSRYGIGEFLNKGYGPSRALGGVGIGTRFSNQINYLNPANYSSQDTLSFLFDVGVFGNELNYITTDNSYKNYLFNIDHFAFSFPIAKWWFSSFGLMPYTGVGYDIVENRPIDGSELLQRSSYNGKGGLNKFYFGNSFKIGNNIAIGVNASYLFGQLEYGQTINILNSDSTSYSGALNSEFNESLDIRDFVFDAGIQIFKTFNEDHTFTMGLTFEGLPKITFIKNKGPFIDKFEVQNNIRVLHSVEKYNILPYYNGKDTLIFESDVKKNLELPEKYGIGFSYEYKEKLLVAFDYTQRNWGKYSFLDRTQQLQDSKSYKVGIQFTPAPNTLRRGTFRSYFDRTSFRVGASATDTYLKFGDTLIKDYYVSAGLGLPLGNSRSKIHISYEYGIKGTTNNNLIEENYGTIAVGFSLYDFWFIRSKFD